MEKKRITGLFLVFALVLGLFGGCAKLPEFDASKYLESQLNVCFKNDSTKSEELGIHSTKEEAEADFNRTVNQFTDSFFIGVSISDKLKQRYREIFADLFSKVDYTVKDNQKLNDNSYIVTVEYKQMKVLKPAIKKMRKKLSKVSTTNLELYQESFFTLMADRMEKVLSKDLKFGTPEVMVFHVEIKDYKYTLNQEDVMTLMNGLIDFDAVEAVG